MDKYTLYKHDNGETFVANEITTAKEGYTHRIHHPKGFPFTGYWALFALKFKFIDFEENSYRHGGGIYILKKEETDDEPFYLTYDGDEVSLTYSSYSRDELMFELTDDECSTLVNNINEVRNFLQTLSSS